VNPGASIGSENEVHFACADRKKITAIFARDIVALTLSDGRQITLRESPSQSGVRYVNNTGTIEFRGERSEGVLVEDGVATFSSCVAEN
jgi:membrane-bound inhibitor of C-type lysozyme